MIGTISATDQRCFLHCSACPGIPWALPRVSPLNIRFASNYAPIVPLSSPMRPNRCQQSDPQNALPNITLNGAWLLSHTLACQSLVPFRVRGFPPAPNHFHYRCILTVTPFNSVLAHALPTASPGGFCNSELMTRFRCRAIQSRAAGEPIIAVFASGVLRSSAVLYRQKRATSGQQDEVVFFNYSNSLQKFRRALRRDFAQARLGCSGCQSCGAIGGPGRVRPA